MLVLQTDTVFPTCKISSERKTLGGDLNAILDEESSEDWPDVAIGEAQVLRKLDLLLMPLMCTRLYSVSPIKSYSFVILTLRMTVQLLDIISLNMPIYFEIFCFLTGTVQVAYNLAGVSKEILDYMVNSLS